MLPEGWLCAKIMAVAPNSITVFKANRMSTTVWLIPPLLKHFFPINGWIDSGIKSKIPHGEGGKEMEINIEIPENLL